MANPVRQYSHRTAFALQEGRMLERYLTSIWYDPRRFPDRLVGLLPHALRRPIVEQLEKRSFPQLEPDRVSAYPFWRAAATVVATARASGASDREQRLFRLHRDFDVWVARKLAHLPFDVFVGYEMASLHSFQACRGRGIKCVLDLAAVHWRTQRRLFGSEGSPGDVEAVKDAELSLADLILTPSAFAEASLREAGIAAGRIARVPFGMDPGTFRPKSRYRKDGPFTVLYVGGITPRKGLETLLEAVAKPPLPGVDLILVGGMDDGGALLRRFEGAASYVPFTRQEDLVPLYQKADVFVLPSRADSFGMVVLEAMACGTPVIVTDTTGARDAVRDGVDGHVIPVGDAPALRAHLTSLRDHPAETEAMGRRAQDQAAAWSWAAYGARLRAALGALETASPESEP